MTRFPLSLLGVVAATLAFASSVHAAAVATLTIDQLSPRDLGVWTLNASDGAIRTSDSTLVSDPKSYTFGVIKAGQNILSVVPPAGSTVKILVYRDGALVATAGQQYTFPLYQDDNYRFIIQYVYNKLGTLGVTSDPIGVPFKLEGPNKKKYNAITPFTFTNIPVGRYTVRPSIVEGCYLSRPMNVNLVADKRVVANFTVTCAQKEDTTVDHTRPTKRAIMNSVTVREAQRQQAHNTAQ